MSINFMQRLPGGLCFAHGPYAESTNCPQWPACTTDAQKPEFVEMGAARVSLKGLEEIVVKEAVNYYTPGTTSHLKEAVRNLLDARQIAANTEA